MAILIVLMAYINPSHVMIEIESLNIEHPRIVFMQFREESGNGTSYLARECNNLFGMKMPSNRPTTAIGKTKSGFAIYKSIRDCIIDYALWQQAYARGLSEDEYLRFLRTTYINDKKYLFNYLFY